MSDILFGPSKNAKPVRKDQRFPPRNPRAQRKPSTGRGLSAVQLIKKVAKTQLNNSKYVQIKSVKKSKTKPLVKFTTITKEPGEQPRTHIQRIYATDPNYQGPLYLCPSIRVTCSCGNFLFQWEVSNAYRGISDIVYSNGDFPIVTNPNLKPGVCKHLLKCLMFLIYAKL